MSARSFPQRPSQRLSPLSPTPPTSPFSPLQPIPPHRLPSPPNLSSDSHTTSSNLPPVSTEIRPPLGPRPTTARSHRTAQAPRPPAPRPAGPARPWQRLLFRLVRAHCHEPRPIIAGATLTSFQARNSPPTHPPAPRPPDPRPDPTDARAHGPANTIPAAGTAQLHRSQSTAQGAGRQSPARSAGPCQTPPE